MTASCALCGRCCDPVPFTREQHEAITAWSSAAMAAAGVPDPRTDDGWSWWLAHGSEYEGERDTACYRFDPGGNWRQDADFIAAHWVPDGDSGCRCDMFDSVTRLCTAGDSKPPVCRGYPWYSDGPTADRARDLFPQCSYLADVPASQRPEGARPLIPVTVL